MCLCTVWAHTCLQVRVVCAASRQPDCYFPFCPYRKARVFSGWGCDVQLKGRIETDYLVNSWHPLAAWNRPERQSLICKWITSRPALPFSSPPFPCLPPSLSLVLFFFFLSIQCQDHLFILCHDRCWAGLPLFPISFSGSQKISTCDFNTSVPPLPYSSVLYSLCTSTAIYRVLDQAEMLGSVIVSISIMERYFSD